MQTFLPFPDFTQSSKCLDDKRLGKQRVECLQILQTLKNGSGWINHPAVQMWKGYENALIEYGIAICTEWKSRGFNDTCLDKIRQFKSSKPLIKPSFINNKKFHDSHKSNLLRKKPEYYSKFNWSVPRDLQYIWPKKYGNVKNSD
jgi:hypothetical protein